MSQRLSFPVSVLQTGAAVSATAVLLGTALPAEYLKGFLERFPVVATYLGAEGLDPAYAALDGPRRDYSPAALHAERDSWTGFQARLAKIEVKALPEPDRIDASVMDSRSEQRRVG